MLQKAGFTYSTRPCKSHARMPTLADCSMAVRKDISACKRNCTWRRLRKSWRSASKLASMPSKNSSATIKNTLGTVELRDPRGLTSSSMSAPGRLMAVL